MLVYDSLLRGRLSACYPDVFNDCGRRPEQPIARDMDNKARSALDKAIQEKAQGNHGKALKRLNETITKYPKELELYLEAVDVCLDAGESLQATQFLKRAHTQFPSDREQIMTLAGEKSRALNDPVLGKFLLEQLIKSRDLEQASQSLEDLPDRAIRDLLQRTRTKRQSMTSAAHGGYSLKGEMVTNALSEALLCLRLGRLKEAARTFLQLIDDKPAENEVLEPFLAGLEKALNKSGRVRIVYAVSLLRANNPERAMQRLVTAVRLEPGLADECLEIIREYTESREDTLPCIDGALVEILLSRGDIARAAELLSEELETQPSRATEIMSLVKQYLDTTEDTLALHYLFMDAALQAEQTLRVLETLKHIDRDKSLRPDLLEWLDTKEGEKFLPPEILVFHGQIAIEEGHEERAAEVLSAVCASSHSDIPAVVRLLEKHRNKHKALDELYDKHHESTADGGGGKAGGAFEFEHFENNEFKFESKEMELDADGDLEAAEEPEIAAEPEPVEDDSEPTEDSDDSNGLDSDFDFSGGRGVFAQTASKDDSIVWEEENDEGDVEPHESDQEDDVTDGEKERKPAIEVTEQWVTSVADALYASGAATFFHVEETAEEEPAAEAEKATEAEVTVEPEPEPAPEPELAESEAEPEPEPADDNEAVAAAEPEAELTDEAEPDMTDDEIEPEAETEAESEPQLETEPETLEAEVDDSELSEPEAIMVAVGDDDIDDIDDSDEAVVLEKTTSLSTDL